MWSVERTDSFIVVTRYGNPSLSWFCLFYFGVPLLVCAVCFCIDRNQQWTLGSNWNWKSVRCVANVSKRCLWWKRRTMDQIVLCDNVCDQRIGNLCVLAFKHASELTSRSISSVGLPPLVSRPESCEAARSFRIPTGGDYTYHHRRWRDLLPHPSRSDNLFFTSIQWSIRDSRHGQLPYRACAWE